jgi:ABC-type dipeptide/oligopeptide/nickel transport system ATPase component
MSNYKDNIKDWYSVISNKKGSGIKVDSNYKKHYIKPCSMICIIGSTGSGKSTALVDFLSRKNNAFYQMIIFSGSTKDEPLYNFLKSKIPDIEIMDNVDELPNLTDFNDEDKTTEKLIVFDDFMNLDNKSLKKIQKFFCSARKYGFTCVALVQNYFDTPIQIRRNIQYYWMFRLNDTKAINSILKANQQNYDLDEIKLAYYKATEEPKNFFMIDYLDNDEKRFRHNFLDFIHINKIK